MRRLVLIAVLVLAAVPAHAARYGIQVAAFKEFERAEFVQEALEDAGYTSYFSEENGYKRVRVGPFSSRADADEEMNALWPFLVARFGPLEFPRSWVVVEDRAVQNAPLNSSQPLPSNSLVLPELMTAPMHIFFPEPTANVASASDTATLLLAAARGFLGVPYHWGGTAPDGFDCSGFVQYLLAEQGYPVPRQAKNQFRVGEAVELDELQPGDLVFFSTYTRGASHVGIWLGDGEFIHASSGTGVVTVTPLSKRYYQNRCIGARRVLGMDRDVLRQMTLLVNR